jgi:hypothetical protein
VSVFVRSCSPPCGAVATCAATPAAPRQRGRTL